MEVKGEVNGVTPLPPRNANPGQGPQGNKMKQNQNQNAQDMPPEKKPRFQNANNQGGGGGVGGGGGQKGGNFGKGFMNRKNRNQNRGGNQKQNQQKQQQQQQQQNQQQQQQNQVKPDGNDGQGDGNQNMPQDQQQMQGPGNNQQRQNQNRGGGNRGPNQQGGGGNRNRNDRMGGGGGNMGGKDFRSQDEHFINQRLRTMAGPTTDIKPLENVEEVKFSGRNRLYIGNLTSDITEEELKEMFAPYGEIGEVFCNAEKNFTFLKVDFHSNAERAKRALDGSMRKGRSLRVRFAPNATVVKVKNLTSQVSNELLHRSFEIFGPVERALVMVDDRGKSTGEGIVEFAKKAGANACLRFCIEKCFFLTASLRPCVVEPYEPIGDNDGLPDKTLNHKSNEYNQERSIGPRTADIGSFEHEYGSRWKQLYELYASKQEALTRELKAEEEKLAAQMEFARFEHETEMLRQELRKRENDNERKKREWEMREKMAEEMRQREEDNLRRRTNEMQNRMMHHDEEMNRRVQENKLFMEAQKLNSMLDSQECNGGNFNNFNDCGNNFPGGGPGNNMGGPNNMPNNGQDSFMFEFGGNQGQGNQRNNNGGGNNIPWERRRRF